MSNFRCNEGAVFTDAVAGVPRPPPLLKRPVGQPLPAVAARSLVDFHSHVMCVPQTEGAAVDALVRYYRHMASLISLPGVGGASDPLAIKMEDANSDVVSFLAIVVTVPGLMDNVAEEVWEVLRVEDALSGPYLDEAVRALLSSNHSVPTVEIHTKHVQRFSGVYRGALIGVRGQSYKVDIRGQPTSLWLTDIFAPTRPSFPWSSVQSLPPPSPLALPVPFRIHFCTGPFTAASVRAVILAAKQRGANATVLLGPIVAEATDITRVVVNQTTADANNLVLDALEAEIAGTAITVFVVPSLDDANAVPVLPQVQLPVDSESSIFFTSNPATIEVATGPATGPAGGKSAPLRIACCAHDAVAEMSENMRERWTDSRRLVRAAEALVASRLLVPPVAFPCPSHDLAAFDAMRSMDDMEDAPPHLFAYTTSQAHVFHTVSHSSGVDGSMPGNGAVVIAAPRTRDEHAITVVEATITDLAQAAQRGLASAATCTTIALHIER